MKINEDFINSCKFSFEGVSQGLEDQDKDVKEGIL
jgi:hypothetical protein